jgi:asparagine synthase (glutamine-hydrolysing)
MMCSVEARVPFVDHRLIELIAGTSFEWRVGKSIKEPLKRLFSGIIPEETIDRKKVGFPVPLDDIFSNQDKGSTPMDKWLNYNLTTLRGM